MKDYAINGILCGQTCTARVTGTCTCAGNFNTYYIIYLFCSGLCNVTMPCQNNGVCTNLKSEDGGYWCKCRPGYTGINCTILQEGPLQGIAYYDTCCTSFDQ